MPTTLSPLPTADLASELTGRVAIPADPDYPALATPWNVAVPSAPLAVVAATEAGDVVAATTEQLVLLWTRAEAARLTDARAAARPGREPGPEGSVAKLQMAELNKAVYELCVDLSGEDGLLVDDDAETAPAFAAVHGGADVRRAYLRSPANSIEAAPPRCCATSSANASSAFPGDPGWTATSPGRTRAAREVTTTYQRRSLRPAQASSDGLSWALAGPEPRRAVAWLDPRFR